MLLLLASLLLSGAVISLDDAARVQVRPENIRYIRTPVPGAERVEDWSRIPLERFSTISDGKRLHFGDHATPTLLRLELDAPRSGRWWFVSELRTPKRFELRLDDAPLGTFGDDHPFSERPLPIADLAIPLDLAQGRHVLFAKIAEPHGPCDLQIHLTPDDAFPVEVVDKLSRDMWITGYMTAIFLLAICLWIAVREPAFAWYVLYFACATLWLMTKRGLGFQFLWPGFPALNAGISVCLAHLAEGTFTLFLCGILQLSRHHPRQNRLLRAAAFVQFGIALPMLANLVWGLPLKFFESFQAVLPLWLLSILALRAWKGRDPLARRLLLAFLPLGLAMTYGTLVEFGLGAGGPGIKATVLTAAALIENTLATLVLLQEVRRREKARLQLEQDFHKKVVESSDELARELAHDLHDGVGQQIYALRMKVFSSRDSIPAELARILDKRIGDLHQELRLVSKRLHPPMLQNRGLEQVLSDLCADSTDPDKTSVRFEKLDDVPDPSETVSTHLYRIAQESLANALRHAQARDIVVRLRTGRKGILLEIEDDGVGLRSASSDGAGLGLSGIHARARAMNGVADISNRPGGGTRVSVRVPV